MATRRFVDPASPHLLPSHLRGPDGCTRSSDQPVRREGEAVRLFTGRGYDWTERYPAIAAAAAKLRAKSFTLDGEAVVAGADGVAVFDALHRRHKATDAMLYAFDLLELDRADLRPLPGERKARLARLCWHGSRPGSCPTSIPMRKAPLCSATPASGLEQPVGAIPELDQDQESGSFAMRRAQAGLW